MTIRSYTSEPRYRRTTFVGENGERAGYLVDDGNVSWLATTDTLEEAEQAKRAFELVLAPRFTRNEAIALVKAYIERGTTNPEEYFAGARAALEALAAAGVFWDGRNMADKLDAAGIR